MASWAYTPTFRGFKSHFGFYNGATDYWSHCHPEATPYGPLDMHWGASPNTPASPVFGVNGTADRNTSDYGPFLFARETLRLLDTHAAAAAAAAAASTPPPPSLFLYLTHQSVHEPIQAPQEYVARCAATVPDKFPKRRIFCGMVAALDDAVQTVTDRMERLGLWRDTLFVFQVKSFSRLLASARVFSRMTLILAGGQWWEPSHVRVQFSAAGRQVHPF